MLLIMWAGLEGLNKVVIGDTASSIHPTHRGEEGGGVSDDIKSWYISPPPPAPRDDIPGGDKPAQVR